MRLFTRFGFFTIVRKPGDDNLTVRARVAADLDALREQYLPELSATTTKGGTDYPCRATCSHAALAAALGRITLDIDYANFKNEVAACQGKGRAQRYGRVWQALYGME